MCNTVNKITGSDAECKRLLKNQSKKMKIPNSPLSFWCWSIWRTITVSVPRENVGRAANTASRMESPYGNFFQQKGDVQADRVNVLSWRRKVGRADDPGAPWPPLMSQPVASASSWWPGGSGTKTIANQDNDLRPPHEYLNWSRWLHLGEHGGQTVKNKVSSTFWTTEYSFWTLPLKPSVASVVKLKKKH